MVSIIHCISSVTGEGIADLRSLIEATAISLPDYGREIPLGWLKFVEVSKNDELGIKKREIVYQHEEFCMKNDEFCRKRLSLWRRERCG